MKIKGKKIIYYVSRWYEGTAYKNISFMQDNFGGVTVKDDITRVRKIIEEMKPDLMIVRGDAKTDYKIPIIYKIPYILIEHDINSLRRGLNRYTERHDREKIGNASAVIFTSEEHAEYYERMKRKHNWKIPYYEIIHTRPLKKDLDFTQRKKMEGLHLVYAGGTIANWRKVDSIYGYRCYHEIFKRFIEAGWTVHIYSASHNQSKLREYREFGCITYNNISYKKLLRVMSQYTAGFHGYNKMGVSPIAYNYTQTCIGNKIWDYLAAGIPTIGYQGGRGMKIYNEKWGIIIDDLETGTLNRIPERLKRLKITKRIRKSNVMDKDIKKFRKVMEIALKGKPKKYIVTKFISKSPFPKIISVENRGQRIISRANHVFVPGKLTEEFQVNESAFKLIKAHIHLKINIKE